MKFYIVENQKPLGPFDVPQLLQHGIKGSDLVWAEGMKDWAPAESVDEIREALYSTPSDSSIPNIPPLPPETGYPEPPVPPATPSYNQEARQQQYANGAQQQHYGNEIPPKTWLAESILVTILCCLPFGIVGIIKASNVSGLWQAGRYEEARAASASAKKWTIIGFFSSIAISVIYIIIVAIATFVGHGFDNI